MQNKDMIPFKICSFYANTTNTFSIKNNIELIIDHFFLLTNGHSIDVMCLQGIDSFNSYKDIINGFINKLEKNNNEVEKSNKEIQSEKDSLLKEFSILKTKYTETSELNEDLNSQLNRNAEDYKSLKTNYIKLKTDYDDIYKKNEAITSEVQLFLNNIHSKLKDKFPEIQKEGINNL